MAQGLVLVADSSAWIAFYRASSSPIKVQIVDAIKNHTILVPDLVLVEVLRGIGSERSAKNIELEFNNYQTIEVVGKGLAVLAASNYRVLRSKGITVRGTVDLLIATWCIENDIPLLHADRDFSGFEQYLGLARWPISEKGKIS